jgi:hypothetical protein
MNYMKLLKTIYAVRPIEKRTTNILCYVSLLRCTAKTILHRVPVKKHGKLDPSPTL